MRQILQPKDVSWLWVCAGDEDDCCDSKCHWSIQDHANNGNPMCDCDRDMIPVECMKLVLSFTADELKNPTGEEK